MFIKFHKTGRTWSDMTDDILINTDHIVAVEADSKGNAIITVTGKDKDDSVLWFQLSDAYEDVTELLYGIGRF